MNGLSEILLPGDDRTVFIELVVLVVGVAVALRLARHNRDLVVFIAGLGLLGFGLIGVRAVH